ncbi:MAG: hypothetical protein LBC56_08660 [Oscillospiraceae bacterium]|jgi:ABC-type multidrug transport system permease subunit|nr:hypothetical protein [Oscillospiraceae bacterium]
MSKLKKICKEMDIFSVTLFKAGLALSIEVYILAFVLFSNIFFPSTLHDWRMFGVYLEWSAVIFTMCACLALLFDIIIKSERGK